jgi:hypothetical protein
MRPLPGRVRAASADLRKRISAAASATLTAILTRQVAGSGRAALNARSRIQGLSGVILAATAARPHLSPLAVVAVLAVLAGAWVIRVWRWPFGPCGKCGGSGRNTGSTGRRWGRCRRCKGTGTRQRLGSRPVHKVLSRKRDVE